MNWLICNRAGKFWVERFRDGWEACTHKKAVAAALFTLFWNISSTTARVWAGTMLNLLLLDCLIRTNKHSNILVPRKNEVLVSDFFFLNSKWDLFYPSL